MRVLIHSGPGIGDVIQFLSMARAIKEQVPGSTVDLLIRGSDNTYKLDKQIIECQDYVNDIYWYSSRKIVHDINLIFKLRKNRYDYGIVRIGNVSNNEPSFWIYRVMRLGGCKKIVGCGTDKVDIRVWIPNRTHYLKRNSMLLEPLGIKGRENAIAINKNKLDMTWVHSLGIDHQSCVIGISLGSNPMYWTENGKSIKYDVKSWPYSYWMELTKRLIKQGYCVILLGGKREEEISRFLINEAEEKLFNMAGKTSIKQSLSLINMCNIVVGCEGGMMHCASSLGVKTLTIFGGSDWKMWNPGGENSDIIRLDCDCSPCFCTAKAAHCESHRCLTDISVDMVFDGIQKILRGVS